MTVRFVSQDVDWTEAMKEQVRSKVIEPLTRQLRMENFEISFHLATERKRMGNRRPKFEMWAVLQTFDSNSNQIVRREGEDFNSLVHSVAKTLRSQVRRQKFKRRFFFNPFKNLSAVGAEQ
jgi:ribosome-associated translation inhibitor RaiA